MRGDREVYTPQVSSTARRISSAATAPGIESAIGTTDKAVGVMGVPVSMSLDGQGDQGLGGREPFADDRIAAKSGSARSREAVPIATARGENRGRQTVYHNVVRNLLKVGDWTGAPGSWAVPMENLVGHGVDGAVVYVQDGSREKPGPMLGAAYSSLH